MLLHSATGGLPSVHLLFGVVVVAPNLLRSVWLSVLRCLIHIRMDLSALPLVAYVVLSGKVLVSRYHLNLLVVASCAGSVARLVELASLLAGGLVVGGHGRGHLDATLEDALLVVGLVAHAALMRRTTSPHSSTPVATLRSLPGRMTTILSSSLT